MRVADLHAGVHSPGIPNQESFLLTQPTGKLYKLMQVVQKQLQNPFFATVQWCIQWFGGVQFGIFDLKWKGVFSK